MTGSYKVTGVDRKGKRFRIYTTNLTHAMGINLWRGNVWVRTFIWPSHLRKGKYVWKRIKSVYN